MSEPERCQQGCVALEGDTEGYPLSASSRHEVARVVGSRVVRAIASGGHEPHHPFSFEQEHLSVEERARLLERIQQVRPPHVLPVSRVCGCSFETPFLEGRPMQDFGLGPDANRLLHPQERRIEWPRGDLERLLAQLVEGLQALHREGIAHGDAALMNAFVVDGTAGPEAVWVDLNSVRPATPEARAVDTAAFVYTCLWPALLDAGQHSPSLFRDLARANREAREVLPAIAAALVRTRADYVAGHGRAALLAALRSTDAGNRSDLYGRVERFIAAAMAPTYFLDQTRADQNARFFQAVLHAERARNKLLEEERTRLHYLRFQAQVDELRGWITEVEKARDYHRQRAEAAEARNAELQEAEAGLAARLRESEELFAARLRESEELFAARLWESEELLAAKLRESEELLAARVRESEELLAARVRESEELLAARVRESEDLLAARVRESEDLLAARAREEAERLAERDRALLDLSRETERLREDLHAIVSSRSWRMLVRMWNLRAALRPGVALWRVARFGYRLLPISGRTRFELRAKVLAWLSVPEDTPPDLAVARLRDLVQRLTWRRAASAAGLLLRGDLASLKMHMNLFVQHSVNQETHQAAFTEPPTEFVVRCQEPWPDSRPLVSVIIPCYNYGHFVAEAVDSVLAQTFQDLEILVIDGGSSSAESLAALRGLERPKTWVYFREGRHFVGDNRNFGISQTQGKYVCCLDADDMIKPTYLEKALFLLETQDYDLVSTSIRCFGDESDIYHLERFPVLADMLQGNQVSTCAVFRKDLWSRTEGFQDAGIGSDYFYEDWRLWVRFAALGARFANIVEEPLFLYRVHSSQSLSRQNQVVPSMDRQREAVIEYNKDVITDEALRISEENRRIKVKMENGFVNLKRGQASAPADSKTILIAMPFLIIGGAERLISEIAAHLGARKFRIVLVTTEYVYPIYGDSTAWFEKATAEIYQLPRFLEPGRWQEFICYLLETRDVSLLWIIGSRVFYELLPRIKSAQPEIKVIDLLFNTVGHTANNRKYARYFDKILVENQEVAAWLLEAGEQPGKVLQIPSGVDLDAFQPFGKSAGILSELGIAPDTFIAGYSGRLSEEKDPEAFLKIAHRCRDDSRLVFLMTGAGPLAEQMEKRIGKMSLGDSLRFLGQVEHVRSYMSSYDVLILPSRFDGRPVAVLESLALGVPVIASRVGALPELIQDGVTGFLCEPGDVEAFAERIRWLAAHPEEHRRMKAAARAFAESALDARQMFERYEAAIRDVID